MLIKFIVTQTRISQNFLSNYRKPKDKTNFLKLHNFSDQIYANTIEKTKKHRSNKILEKEYTMSIKNQKNTFRNYYHVKENYKI